MTDPILIWGAGAIGATLGMAFARAGEAVTFVDLVPEHVAALRHPGLRLTGGLIDDLRPFPAFTPAELQGQFRRTFLCVKAHHTRAAIAQMAPHVAPDGFVVSAQNGLNELVIAEAVGAPRTVGCFVNFGADYLEPGTVLFGGRAAVVVGELDGARTPRIEAIHQLMLRFEPNALLTPNIWGFLWGKLIYGALLFATALTPHPIADVLDDPAHRAVLTRLGREIGAVAAAQRIALEGFDGFDPGAFTPDAPADRTERSFADMVAHNRRSLKTHSGIYRDLAVRRRKTEVDDQLGPIATEGAKRGIPTPLTTRLIAMIHEIEQGARPMTDANLAELAAC